MITGTEHSDIDGDTPPEESELDLTEDDSLPWLEAEEEDEESGGIDLDQIVTLLLGLAVLGFALWVAVWWFSKDGNGDNPVADGSVIEAPEGEIKTRPDDPGGKEFAGTGNVAPVVGEGGTREGVMNTDGEGASGSGSGSGKGASKGGSKGSGSAGNSVASGSVGVQLAAYSSRARAEQGWNEIRGRTKALANSRYVIEQGEVDIGTVYRLKAVAANRAAADRLCAALKADGLDCQVKP